MTVNQGTEAPETSAPDKKLADIIAEQEAIFVRRQPGSARLARTAQGALAGGVTSSWQITAPQPVWLSHGQGSKVYDVDGQAYVDLHGGYGASLAGHAHPAIVRAASSGIPAAIVRLTLVASFNDLAAVDRLLTEHRGQVAGMIVEPIMMNSGIIRPEPGYLAAIKDLLHAHGALLTFDEVKTGLTSGPAGVTGLSGVVPDIICLAKALGGGVAVAAVGGTAEVMAPVASGGYEIVGTFNGNPLAMAAARAMLTEVATPAAYDHIDALRDRAVTGIEAAIREHGLAAHVVAVGAKGCVVFSPEPVRDYRGFLAADDRYSHAHWLYQHNGGVFLPPWGKIEQWLISVQHDQADIDLLVGNFRRFAAAVAA